MRLELLREFIAISRYGSYTKAAAELYSTQPTLSNHIRQLEAELGFEVVDHSSKGFSLTDEGCVMLTAASRIVSEYDQAIRECASLSCAPVFRIQESKCEMFRTPFFQMMTQYEVKGATKPRIVTVGMDERDTIDLLFEGEVDVGFQHFVEDCGMSMDQIVRDPERVRYARLVTAPCELYVDLAHPLAGIERLTLADLDGYEIFSFVGDRSGQWFDMLRRRLALSGATVHAYLERLSNAGGADPLMHMTRDNAGCIFPLFARRSPKAEGAEVARLALDPPIMQSVYIAYMPEHLDPDQLRFVEHMVESYPGFTEHTFESAR